MTNESPRLCPKAYKRKRQYNTESAIMEIQVVLFSALLLTISAQSIDLNEITFSVLAPEVKNQAVIFIREDFANTNASLSALKEIYRPCTELISDQLLQQCVNCISEKCQNKANVDCTGEPLKTPVSIDKEVIACDISPTGCGVLGVGKKAVKVQGNVGRTVKNVIKKVTSGIKIKRGIRVRMPLIRVRGIQIFRRRRRQTTESTCEEIATNPDEACKFFSTQCEACADLRDADELLLVERFCGVDVKTVYTDLKTQENRIARLGDIYDLSDPNVFNITKIQYDASQYDVNVPGYHGVRVRYTLLGKSTTLVLKDPVNLLDPNNAIPVMTQLLYEDLVP
ncbi:uncharacterized protein LOC135478263 [Liolophura sinensis]|uniref:uncharacterized protein LOC135478263 n=1 Tax=Liolophura sinensis TaxID=3198878 RepID=UPI00315990A4